MTPTPVTTAHGSREIALRRVVTEILAGLRHGYFEITVSSEVIGRGRRRLVVRAGKHYQFVIPEEECLGMASPVDDLHEEGTPEEQS